MGLATNNCKKHGGYVEDQCPKCVADNYMKAVRDMKQFFEHFGEHELVNTPVTIEDLFQHFRIRLLEEIGS